MANKDPKCETCVDHNTDYWQRPCFICVFGDKYHDEDKPISPAVAKTRWKDL
jgi:hypothetical protein